MKLLIRSLLASSFFFLLSLPGYGQNVLVINPTSKPVPIAGTITAVSSAAATTEVKSSALETSHVLKASAGTLVYLGVHNTGASALSIMIINATSLPANGAVSLLYPAIKIPAGGDISLNPPVPITASTGITIAGSTTDTFSLTVGGSVLEIYGQVR